MTALIAHGLDEERRPVVGREVEVRLEEGDGDVAGRRVGRRHGHDLGAAAAGGPDSHVGHAEEAADHARLGVLPDVAVLQVQMVGEAPEHVALRPPLGVRFSMGHKSP